jgi:ubiquinone/menaquinone biosynthesis C-methylase UbiE
MASKSVELELLPREQYVGVNDNDPIRFYYWPVFGRMYRRRVELCLAELSGGERVLEIGFGTGLTFLNLRQRYREIHGLDLTADIDKVSALWRDKGLEVHLRNGNVLELPYADDSFDSVLLISILEHLKPSDQPRAMAEIRRVLKPGGQVVYGVPIERPLMVFMFRVLGYNIREHHFSTEKDVRDAAGAAMTQVRIVRMKGAAGLAGAVYEVGHFTK